MTRVWVVLSTDADDPTVVGVYSSEELAKEARHAWSWKTRSCRCGMCGTLVQTAELDAGAVKLL